MFYSVKEGLKGFKRAKFSSFISVSTIAISLILLGIFLIITVNMKRFVGAIKERVEFEVFIDNSLDNEKIKQLEKEIQGVNGVAGVKFVSKEEAARIFQKQFGKEFFDLVEENPLPASFRISLVEAYQTSKKSHEVAQTIGKLEGVDEVLYRRDLLVIVEKYIQIIIAIALVVAGIVSVASIVLISNTIRLIILARENIIETMKLVGATRGFIRRPFLVEGIIQGAGGGVLAASFLCAVVKIVRIEITGIIEVDRELYGLILFLGFILGLLGSYIAIRRFLKY